jgi:hypothetical protein
MLKTKWESLGAWSPLAALKQAGETKWLIDGVIPSGSINWMVAAPSSFKTFVALDMAVCIASGRTYHGRETDNAVVLYLAGEGDNDIHVRRAAADMAANDTGPLCIVQARPRLDTPHGIASLMAMIADVTYTGGGSTIEFPEIQTYYNQSRSGYLTPEELDTYEKLLDESDELLSDAKAEEYALRISRPRFNAWDEAIARVYEDTNLQLPGGVDPKKAKNIFLVIDTYSQTSADDTKGTVSLYVKTLKDLQEKVTAAGGTLTVLVIDHTTKSGDSYMGSLAKEGDSDTMIEVGRRGDDYAVTLKSTKMRSAACFAPIHLDLQPFTLEGYVDAQNRPLTSLIVVDGEQAHRVRKATGSSGDTAAALVLALLTESGTCSKAELKQVFMAHSSNTQKNTDSVSRAFNRAFTHLTKNEVILEDSDGTVALPENSVLAG